MTVYIYRCQRHIYEFYTPQNLKDICLPNTVQIFGYSYTPSKMICTTNIWSFGVNHERCPNQYFISNVILKNANIHCPFGSMPSPTTIFNCEQEEGPTLVTPLNILLLSKITHNLVLCKTLTVSIVHLFCNQETELVEMLDFSLRSQMLRQYLIGAILLSLQSTLLDRLSYSSSVRES